jgi:hypothetical protein
MVGGDEFNTDVGAQIDVESLAAINLVLTAGEIALEHLGDGQSGNSENVQCFFHGLELGRGNDGGDEFHGHPFLGLGGAADRKQLAARRGLGEVGWVCGAAVAAIREVLALQWDDVDLDNGILRLDENYVRTSDGMIIKDTKTHQMRRVSIDQPTVTLLREYRENCRAGRGRMISACRILSSTTDATDPRRPTGKGVLNPRLRRRRRRLIL